MPNNTLQGINVNGTVYKYDYGALENVPEYLSMPDLKDYYYEPILGICTGSDDNKKIGWREPNSMVDAVLKRETADTNNVTPPILIASTSSSNYSWEYVDEIMWEMLNNIDDIDDISEFTGDEYLVFLNSSGGFSTIHLSTFINILKLYLTTDDTEYDF